MAGKVAKVQLRKFKDNLRHAESYVRNNPKEAKFLKDFLFRINRYVKKLKAQNPDLTGEDLKRIFEQDLREISEPVFQSAEISKYYMQYACYDIFARNPEEFIEYVDYMDEYNLKYRDIKTLTRSTFRIAKLYYAALLRQEFESQTEVTDLREFIIKRRNELIPQVNSVLATSISGIVKQLDKYSFLSNYLEMNTKKLASLGFQEFSECLMPPANERNGRYDSRKLLSLLSKERLETNYSPEDLLTLFSFWTNRYSKELDSYLQAAFVIKDFDLYDSYASGNFKSPPVDVLQRSLVKINLFYDPVKFYLEMKKGEELAESGQVEFDSDNLDYDIDSSSIVANLVSEYGKDYADYFDKNLPESKNDLPEDIKSYFDLYKPIFATYSLKDSSIIYLLLGLTAAQKYNNGGIIKSTLRDKFIGIGIDNGLTDTFLVHINRGVLSDFVTEYLGNELYLFPLYHGDYDYTRRTYQTPIMAPLSTDQLQLLDYHRETPSRYIQHMRSVANYKEVNVLRDYVTIDRNGFTHFGYKPDEIGKKFDSDKTPIGR